MRGTLGRSLAPCPVDGCDFDLAVASANAAADPIRIRVGQPLGDAIDESARENAAAREAALRTHLETHDVMDWMRTVRRLEQELYTRAGAGVGRSASACGGALSGALSRPVLVRCPLAGPLEPQAREHVVVVLA